MTAILPAGNVRGRQAGRVEQERQRHQRAPGRGGHLRRQRDRARPARCGSRCAGRRRRRAQGRGSGPVTQPVSGRCPRSCGGSKNTVCRNWSWQRLQVTQTCPMPRPRPAASRAGSADARRPAHLRLTGPQLVSERAALWLVIEQRNGHLNDHARTGRYASIISRGRIRTRSRRRRPRRGDPRRMRRPRWRRQEQAPHGAGQRRPRRSQWPGRLLAAQPVRLGGKFLGAAVMLWSGSRGSTCLVACALGVMPRTLSVTPPTTACPPGDGAGNRPADRSVSPMRHGRGRGLG